MPTIGGTALLNANRVGEREAIVTALEAASLNPEVPKFTVGVLQT